MPLQEANFIYKIYWKPLPEKRPSHHLWQTYYYQKKSGVYGDTNFNYTYSNTTKQALIWTGVTKIKTLLKKNGRNLQFLLLQFIP
jgi:hypothetical protein